MKPHLALAALIEARDLLDRQIQQLRSIVAMNEADAPQLDLDAPTVKDMAVATLKGRPPGEMVSDEEVQDAYRRGFEGENLEGEQPAVRGVRWPRH